MSSSLHIFNYYLCAGESVTLEFLNKADVLKFLGVLRVLKHRHIKEMRALGMEEESPMNNKVIAHEVLETNKFGAIKVKIFLHEVDDKKRIEFKILSSSSN